LPVHAREPKSGLPGQEIAIALKYLTYWFIPMGKPLSSLVREDPVVLDTAKRLRAHGIRTNLDLLERASTIAGRKALCEASGLPDVVILELVNRADFSRMPWASKATIGSGKRPKVRVMLGSHTYRSTVAVYGDLYMIPLSAENRTAAGVQTGDAVKVTLELDTEPRMVYIPADLAAALVEKPGAMDAFEAQSYTLRKEAVITSAFTLHRAGSRRLRKSLRLTREPKAPYSSRLTNRCRWIWCAGSWNFGLPRIAGTLKPKRGE
jgi:hypothetical protein